MSEKPRKYVVRYRYINTGEEHETTVTLTEADGFIDDYLNSHWRGLLCNSGGYRSIIKITQES